MPSVQYAHGTAFGIYYVDCEEWVTDSREARTAHLDMSEPCIERGGNSTVHRGVLAQYLGTNIPNKIDLCHNCGNGKCSNPKHLYWGTRKENVEDAKRHGSWKTGWEKMVTSLHAVCTEFALSLHRVCTEFARFCVLYYKFM